MRGVWLCGSPAPHCCAWYESLWEAHRGVVCFGHAGGACRTHYDSALRMTNERQSIEEMLIEVEIQAELKRDFWSRVRRSKIVIAVHVWCIVIALIFPSRISVLAL